MPAPGRDVVIMLVLVLCVPLQYWLTQKYSISPEQRKSKLNTLFHDLTTTINKWNVPQMWMKYILEKIKVLFKKDYSPLYVYKQDPLGECPAVEVLLHRNPKEHFATSPFPRKSRPRTVKWKVGQVVRHVRSGYKGVIIGWDQHCKAPEKWIEEMHGNNVHWRSEPNYAILVHEGDRQSQITYVVQENIFPIKETVWHKNLTDYFDHHDGAQYVPQRWLKAIYPRD